MWEVWNEACLRMLTHALMDWLLTIVNLRWLGDNCHLYMPVGEMPAKFRQGWVLYERVRLHPVLWWFWQSSIWNGRANPKAIERENGTDQWRVEQSRWGCWRCRGWEEKEEGWVKQKAQGKTKVEEVRGEAIEQASSRWSSQWSEWHVGSIWTRRDQKRRQVSDS